MKTLFTAILAIIALSICSANAQDQAQDGEEDAVTPQAFLQALAGNFRGRGEVLVGTAKDMDRVSCRLSNSLEEGTFVLSVKGTCATTQGRVNVDGILKMDGDTGIVGSFISTNANSEVTKSISAYENGTLTLSLSMVHKQTGNLSRTRQVVVTDETGGFQTTFYRFENASDAYRQTGSVVFSPAAQ